MTLPHLKTIDHNYKAVSTYITSCLNLNAEMYKICQLWILIYQNTGNAYTKNVLQHDL